MQAFMIIVDAHDKNLITNEDACFDVFSLHGFGEVGGGDERDAAIHNHTFGLLAGSLLGILRERARVVRKR